MMKVFFRSNDVAVCCPVVLLNYGKHYHDDIAANDVPIEQQCPERQPSLEIHKERIRGKRSVTTQI